LLADGLPFLAVDEIQDKAGDGVGHGRPVEQREHEPEEWKALLGVEATVNRVDEHPRKVGAEAA
jgi:hypothetical protein